MVWPPLAILPAPRINRPVNRVYFTSGVQISSAHAHIAIITRGASGVSCENPQGGHYPGFDLLPRGVGKPGTPSPVAEPSARVGSRNLSPFSVLASELGAGWASLPIGDGQTGVFFRGTAIEIGLIVHPIPLHVYRHQPQLTPPPRKHRPETHMAQTHTHAPAYAFFQNNIPGDRNSRQ